MCVIAIKPAGVPAPNELTIENMWYNNDDGAGFMYPTHGGVKIRKGYMTLKDLKKALKALEKEIDIVKTPIVYHFRIGTSGGNIAANTHPFPVTERLAALRKTQITARLAVAHNGIIDIQPRKNDISDTMEYILSQLAPLYQLKKDFYKREEGKKIVYNATASKLAFMDASGRIETIGKFEKKDGILYSNSSYKARTYYTYWDKWDDYTDRWYAPTGKVKLLQWLTSDDGYIEDKGELFDASDYLIDRDKQLYMFDDYENAAFLVSGQAYTHAGTPLQYAPEKATMYSIID